MFWLMFDDDGFVAEKREESVSISTAYRIAERQHRIASHLFLVVS